MSRENLELVHRCFEAWNTNNQKAWLETFDPEVEIRAGISGGVPAIDAESLSGYSDLTRWWDDMREAHERFVIRIDDIRDLGERVLVIGATIGRGRGGGVEFEAPHAWVGQTRAGKVLRFDSYTDPKEALEAVGLRE